MYFKTLIFCALSAIFATLHALPGHAETKRSATVKIKNETGKHITGVYVFHKYSDEYRDFLTFGKIAPNGLGFVKDNSRQKTVRYYTGAFTTGKDWWLVVWFYQDGSDYMLRTTDPSNGRCPLDFLEKIVMTVAPIALDEAPALVSAIGKEIVKSAMNDTRTCGFKQHILRSEDADQNTTIHLKANGDVVFASRSGISETVSRPQILGRIETPSPTVTDTQGAFIALAANSGKCLHKQREDFDNGNIIHLWDCAAGVAGNKRWVFDQTTGYIHAAENRDKCLHKRDSGWTNGNPIHLWDCTAGPAENKTWAMTNGMIKARENGGKCLHKQEDGFRNGNRIHLWDCAAGPDENKTWRVAQ